MKCKIKDCIETTRTTINTAICWGSGFCPKHYAMFIGYKKNYDPENMPFQKRSRSRK